MECGISWLFKTSGHGYMRFVTDHPANTLAMALVISSVKTNGAMIHIAKPIESQDILGDLGLVTYVFKPL